MPSVEAGRRLRPTQTSLWHSLCGYMESAARTLLKLEFCADLTAENVRETDSGFPQMMDRGTA